MLDKFYIGDLERPAGAIAEPQWGYVEYDDDESESSFYNTMKRRVEAHFKSKKVGPCLVFPNTLEPSRPEETLCLVFCTLFKKNRACKPRATGNYTVA